MENKNIDKKHYEDLGFKVPDEYFLKSKNEILSKVLANKKESKIIKLFKNKMSWYVAASIALIFTLSIYNSQTKLDLLKIPAIVSDTLNSNRSLTVEEGYFFEDDFLISSLFINDVNLDSFIANTFIKEIAIEEQLDDFIIDNLMDDELF